MKADVEVIDGFIFEAFETLNDLINADPISSLENGQARPATAFKGRRRRPSKSRRDGLLTRRESKRPSQTSPLGLSAVSSPQAPAEAFTVTLKDACRIFSRETLVSVDRQMVFARMKGYPFWPGVVLQHEGEAVVRYLGEATYSLLDETEVRKFTIAEARGKYLAKAGPHRATYVRSVHEAGFLLKRVEKKSAAGAAAGNSRNGKRKRIAQPLVKKAALSGKSWPSKVTAHEACLKIYGSDDEDDANEDGVEDEIDLLDITDDSGSDGFSPNAAIRLTTSQLLQANCGQCTSCRNMPQFGGKTKRKKLTCLKKNGKVSSSSSEVAKRSSTDSLPPILKAVNLRRMTSDLDLNSNRSDPEPPSRPRRKLRPSAKRSLSPDYQPVVVSNKRGTRGRLPFSELSVLQSAFEKNANPSNKAIEGLAKQLGHDGSKRVRMWFKRQRTKAKQEAEQRLMMSSDAGKEEGEDGKDLGANKKEEKREGEEEEQEAVAQGKLSDEDDDDEVTFKFRESQDKPVDISDKGDEKKEREKEWRQDDSQGKDEDREEPVDPSGEVEEKEEWQEGTAQCGEEKAEDEKPVDSCVEGGEKAEDEETFFYNLYTHVFEPAAQEYYFE